MTADNEQENKKSKSICPIHCMGRRKKEHDATDETFRRDAAIPAPIDEFPDHDSITEPGYARIGSMMKVDSASEMRSNSRISEAEDDDDEDDEDDDDDGEPVEEEIVAQATGTADASIGVYAQVNKPSAPGLSGPSAPSYSDTDDEFDMKQKSEKIPTPRSAMAAPVASQRSANFGKRVNFNQSARADSDLGEFGSLMQQDIDEQQFAKDNTATATHQTFLPGVSLSSYGLSSLTPDQSAQLDSRKSMSTEQSVGSEVQNLKKTIRSLTSELSRQLTSRDATDAEQGMKLLPGKGPVPPWLCDSRVFAPLLAVYEQRLAGRTEAAERCETRLKLVESRVQDVVKENERLRLKLRESSVAGPASQNELEIFREQARLVLEENQLMINQLNLQQEKAKQAQKSHSAEAIRLKCRIEELETENGEIRAEFDQLRGKLQEVKSKYQHAVMDKEDHELLTVDRVKSLTVELQAAKDLSRNEVEEMKNRLVSMERERSSLADALADAVAEKEKFLVEVNGLKHLLQNKHRDNLLLRKFAKKHSSLKHYLDSVISEATKLQNQRDSCKEALETQEHEFGKLVNQLVSELHTQSSRQSTNGQKQNGVEKLERLIGRLVELLKDNEGKREEAEKQVQYLQALLKQKSLELERLQADKQTVEDQLETAWRAAAD